MTTVQSEVVARLTLEEMLEQCSDESSGALIDCNYKNLSPEQFSRLLEARSYPNEYISRELQEVLDAIA